MNDVLLLELVIFGWGNFCSATDLQNEHTKLLTWVVFQKAHSMLKLMTIKLDNRLYDVIDMTLEN